MILAPGKVTGLAGHHGPEITLGKSAVLATAAMSSIWHVMQCLKAPGGSNALSACKAPALAMLMLLHILNGQHISECSSRIANAGGLEAMYHYVHRSLISVFFARGNDATHVGRPRCRRARDASERHSGNLPASCHIEHQQIICPTVQTILLMHFSCGCIVSGPSCCKGSIRRDGNILEPLAAPWACDAHLCACSSPESFPIRVDGVIYNDHLGSIFLPQETACPMQGIPRTESVTERGNQLSKFRLSTISYANVARDGKSVTGIWLLP